jgi:hypothetical protein
MIKALLRARKTRRAKEGGILEISEAQQPKNFEGFCCALHFSRHHETTIPWNENHAGLLAIGDERIILRQIRNRANFRTKRPAMTANVPIQLDEVGRDIPGAWLMDARVKRIFFITTTWQEVGDNAKADYFLAYVRNEEGFKLRFIRANEMPSAGDFVAIWNHSSSS